VFTLIFSIVFGLALSFFALQNTNRVTITLANIPFSDVPLWVIIVISVLVGLIFASYFNVINIVTSALKLHNKDNAIKGADNEIQSLKNENKKLREENEELKTKKDSPLVS